MAEGFQYSRRRMPAFGFFFGSWSATFFLIILNVLFFAAGFVLLILQPSWLMYIALQPQTILQGKALWTFFTSMFMHGGIFHLFANMFSLFFVGALLERLIGKKRYVLFYLLSGLFAGMFFVLISFLTKNDLTAYAVGASGALFGLIGFLMLITPNLPVYILFIPIPIKMKYAAPLILIALWLISLTPMAFGGEKLPIGNTAHLGGLLAGFIYGVYMRLKYKRKAAAISRYFS
jgi:membrane associated rhomboid family serine protease